MRTMLSLIARIIAVIALIVIVLLQYRATDAVGRELNDSLNPACDAVQGLALAQVSAAGELTDYAHHGTQRSLNAYRHQIDRADILLTQIAEQFDAGDEIEPMITSTRSAQRNWVAVEADPVIAAMEEGDAQAAAELTGTQASQAAFREMNIETQRLHRDLTMRQQLAAEQLLRSNRLLGALLVIAAIAMLLMILTYYVSVRRWILRPLERMRRDLREATDSIDHLHPIDGSGPPELASVAVDAEELRRRLVAEIDEARAARAGLEQDAPLVAALRRTMHSGDVPANSLVEISGLMSSAEGVIAGDWWDAVRTRSGNVAVVIADVSGHGAISGVTAAQVRALLRSALRADAAPDSALRLAADALEDSVHFVTAVVLVFAESADGIDVHWANAGHHAPLLQSADGSVRELVPTGPLLSALGGTWHCEHVAMRADDVLLAFTDGLIERRESADLESLELAALLLAAAGGQRCHPAEILQRLLAEIRANAADWARDDVTAVAIAPRQP